jgi:outer membrane biosynthesis protein TonB
VAPIVTFKDGLLTVQALNSNLSSVVTAIRNKTGIEFEGAENISERVAISMGPAPEGDVLAAIFAGSKYDFLAIGRPDSPNIVQRVILTVKNQPGAAGEVPAQPAPAAQSEEEEVPDEQVNTGEPQDTPVQPVPVPQAQPPQTQTPPNQPKSPEQLLQELQEMRRQKGSPEDPTNNPNPAPRKMPPR